MQATKITWDDKVGLIPRKIRINQCQDRDLNEVKTAINNNADLLDQFTFSDPLGNIGIGGTPTAKLSVIGTTPGQDLFDVTDDSANERILVDGVKTTITGSSSGTFDSPLVVNQTSPYSGLFDQYVQSWQVQGQTLMTLRADGSLSVSPGLGRASFGTFSASASGNANVVQYRSYVGGIGTGLNFPTLNNASLVTNKKEALRVDEEQRVGIGTSLTPSGNSSSNIETTAVFHVDANNDRFEGNPLKGSIPFPRLSETERLAIVSPATGLHVYQTDGTEGVYVNKSTGWVFAY